MQQQIQFYEQKLSYEIDSSDLYKAIQNNSDYIIIDTRQPSGYEKEHIPGAINLPHRDMNEETTRHLNKSKTYVCYCDGIGCNASTKGALNMTKLGFNVKELMGGIEWWKFDGYDTEGSHQSKNSTFGCTC
ncbi:rhodanese-like domain-containing protein [Chryseobacterium sp.]|uniref:rhodanese-like domain-containing protein n=1 Tax=Chryseobacterium sp. TaxID=1871047 RepID=UPI0025B8AEC4|nr:rhodanese-like domain-containing protein [Chryseobacterium sp.]